MSGKNGWIGVDFDGTLAHYDKWKGPGVVGAPVQAMVDKVKQWITEGETVKIFTARVCPLNALIPASQPAKQVVLRVYQERNDLTKEDAYNVLEAAVAIRAFCKEHIGQVLDITNVKDFAMIALYDDRAFHVIENRGIIVKG